jgi:parallel beta-helix repeat protein
MLICSFTPVLSADDSSSATVSTNPLAPVVSTNPPAPVPANQGDPLNQTYTFTINITISNVTDLTAWQFGLYWNNSELNCTGAAVLDPSSWKDGSVSCARQVNNSYTSTTGYFFNGQAALCGDDFNGTVTVATLTFSVLGVTSTNTLSVSDVELLDSFGNDIAISSTYITTTSSGATVHIDAVPIPPPAPTPVAPPNPPAPASAYINTDGSISPSTAPIHSTDNNTYTLTGNITADADGIVIERDNIVLDGAGYTVTGSGNGNGTMLTNGSNVTVRNMTIENFDYGICLTSSSNNTLFSNNVMANEYDGIDLYSSSGNTLSGNKVTNSIIEPYSGDTFGETSGIGLYSSSNNILSWNNVTANTGYGIGLNYSLNNSLSDNNLNHNGHGVFLYYSSNNSISENNITALILNMTIEGSAGPAYLNDYCGADYVNVTATTEKVDNCILSYTFMCWDNNGTLSPLNDGTVWTNVTMTRNGDSFSGIIYLNTTAWDAWHAVCNCRVIASDISGYSMEASGGFLNFFDDP